MLYSKSRYRCPRIVIALFFTSMITVATNSLALQASKESLQAAISIKFLNFVKFPAQKSTTVVCILGEDLLLTEFQRYDQRKLGAQTLSVIPFPSSPSQCDVLFISNSHFEVWPEIRPNINGLPILTIAMQNTFCELGGMIQIEQRENTLKFSINLKEARQNHLDIRSALLKLAEKVY